MPTTIRFAGPADADTLYEFIRGLAEYEHALDAVEVTPAILQAQLASPRPPFECLLAEDGPTPLGFALFVHNYSTWRGRPGIWLEDLFVPPRHRRGGVATALLRRVAAVAVERDCARFEWAVLDWNEPARHFYQSLGAVALDKTINIIVS